jgi:hypothetical protein
VRRLSWADVERILDFLGYYPDPSDPTTYTRGAPIERRKAFWLEPMVETDYLTVAEFEDFLVNGLDMDAGEVRAAIAKVIG